MGERWKMTSDLTRGAISGRAWIALAPVPTHTTRFPARSTSWRHRAVWNCSPGNASQFLTGGVAGLLSCPVATMKKLALRTAVAPVRKSRVVTTHSFPSNSADSTLVSKEARAWSELSRATPWTYARISSCSAHACDQSPLVANEKE